jgi:hypothetical protein
MKMADYGARLHVLHVMPPLPPATTSRSQGDRQLTNTTSHPQARWREPT